MYYMKALGKEKGPFISGCLPTQISRNVPSNCSWWLPLRKGTKGGMRDIFFSEFRHLYYVDFFFTPCMLLIF